LVTCTPVDFVDLVPGPNPVPATGHDRAVRAHPEAPDRCGIRGRSRSCPVHLVRQFLSVRGSKKPSVPPLPVPAQDRGRAGRSWRSHAQGHDRAGEFAGRLPSSRTISCRTPRPRSSPAGRSRSDSSRGDQRLRVGDVDPLFHLRGRHVEDADLLLPRQRQQDELPPAASTAVLGRARPASGPSMAFFRTAV